MFMNISNVSSLIKWHFNLKQKHKLRKCIKLSLQRSCLFNGYYFHYTSTIISIRQWGLIRALIHLLPQKGQMERNMVPDSTKEQKLSRRMEIELQVEYWCLKLNHCHVSSTFRFIYIYNNVKYHITCYKPDRPAFRFVYGIKVTVSE